MFAPASELNRCSEMMGNAVRNTALSNPLLYLLFAVDYTSPASQRIVLQDDTTKADAGTGRRRRAASLRAAIPGGTVCSERAEVNINQSSVQLYLQMSPEKLKSQE